jgi:hypothetical protein
LKLRLTVVVSLFLMLLLLPLSLVGSFGVPTQEKTSEIIVPWASSAEADGFIELSEYDDALEIDLSNATWEAYLYLKHDGEFLYVFTDHVSDTIHHPAGYDNCYVAIDTLNDGGNEPREDDYLFHSSGHHVWVGEGGIDIPGSQWEELTGHLNYSASGPGAFGYSPNSLISHSIFEIKIPITGWEIEEANRTFGFCVAAGSPGTDGDFLAKTVWPATAYANYTADFYPGGVRTLDPLVFDPHIGSFSSPSIWGTIMLGKAPEETITAPLAKVEARADGFISPGEWDDAAVVVVGYPDSYGYLYLKHNNTFLWLFLDHVTDTVKSPLGWDNGWIAIDPDMSGGSEPQEYDMLFHSHGHLVFIGDGVDPINGSQWGILRGHLPEDTPQKYAPLRDVILANYYGSGPSWGPTEASDTPHAFFELQIPLGILELIPGLANATEFGFCASMQDNDAETIIDWPVTQSTGNFWPGPDSPEGSYAPPDSWGTLTLGTESLTEKPPLPPPPTPILTKIDLATRTSSAYLGLQVNLTGSLIDLVGHGLSGENVVLSYIVPGTSSWTVITSTATLLDGSYLATWIPTATGYFTIKAEWSGNSTHMRAAKNASLSIIPYQDQHVFSVESNSTVSDLVFNAGTATLQFTVIGQNGTIGFAKVTISRSLITDVSELTVYVDSNPANYSVEEDPKSYYVYFTYEHSAHSVTLSNWTIIPEFPSAMTLFLPIILTLIVAVVRKTVQAKRSKRA